MGDRKIYVVAKVFDQQGCIAYLCKTPNEARCLPGTLEALRAEGGTDRHSGLTGNLFRIRTVYLHRGHERVYRQGHPVFTIMELSITDADIIVAGGRGMGSAENFGLIRELAGLLGAAVCAPLLLLRSGQGLIAAGVQTAKPFSRVLHLKLRKVWCKCLTRFEK